MQREDIMSEHDESTAKNHREDLFRHTLGMLRYGEMEKELTDALAECISRAQTSGKVTELTLKIKIKPRQNTGQYLIEDDITTKPPSCRSASRKKRCCSERLTAIFSAKTRASAALTCAMSPPRLRRPLCAKRKKTSRRSSRLYKPTTEQARRPAGAIPNSALRGD